MAVLIALAYPERAAPVAVAVPVGKTDNGLTAIAFRLIAAGVLPASVEPSRQAIEAALAALAPPSGLYPSRQAAESAIRAAKAGKARALLAGVLATLAPPGGRISPVELGAMLGYRDQTGRIGADLFAGRRLLDGPALRVLAHIRAGGPMIEAEAAAVLAELGGGSDAAALRIARARFAEPSTGRRPGLARLADWLGYAGRAGVGRILAGGTMTGPARRCLAHTLADGPITATAAERIFARVDRGRWRQAPPA